MTWDRESNEEYDDGYTRESFERAEEDTPETLEPLRPWAVLVVTNNGDIDSYGPYKDGADAQWAAQCLLEQRRDAAKVIAQEMA